jgi:CelD/BcsL family acetyltransferase involved in cellulose biosynthesis
LSQIRAADFQARQTGFFSGFPELSWVAVSDLLSGGLTKSSAHPQRVRVVVYTARDWSKVGPLWGNLADNSPYSSFYLSADWIAAWLEVFADSLRPEILVFEEESTPVGACLLVKTVERRGPFRVRRIYLNTGGEDLADRAAMEFNSVLCLAGCEQPVAESLGAYLRTLEWDEFAMEGMSPNLVLNWLQTKTFPELSATTKVRPSYYVGLDRLRQFSISYESSLSPNSRQQIRRSLRLYGERGTIRTEVAQQLARAEQFFDELRDLHLARWRGRGGAGAFASPRRLAFHRALIRRAFGRGGIQMLRVTAGEETVGVLYNFVQKGKVYFFQSGINYGPAKRLKPGLVTHVCAIRCCLEQGFDDYDFLAGEARYKRSLAKDCRLLAWVVFARPGIKLWLINFLRALKGQVRRSFQPLRIHVPRQHGD